MAFNVLFVGWPFARVDRSLLHWQDNDSCQESRRAEEADETGWRGNARSSVRRWEESEDCWARWARYERL